MSIYEYDKEKEEKKLRKAEYEAGYESGREEGYNSGKEEGYNSGKEAGYESGREAGYNSGKEAVKQELIRNMYQEGLGLEQISKISGLEVSELRKMIES